MAYTCGMVLSIHHKCPVKKYEYENKLYRDSDSFAFAAFCLQKMRRCFKKLYALEGTWKMNGKRGPVFEEWTKVDKNYLQSRSYFVRNADTIINERVTLTNTKAGIFYTPVVEDQNNKQPIPFKMTGSKTKALFLKIPNMIFPNVLYIHLLQPIRYMRLLMMVQKPEKDKIFILNVSNLCNSV